jgi:hypothetical protein
MMAEQSQRMFGLFSCLKNITLRLHNYKFDGSGGKKESQRRRSTREMGRTEVKGN